MFTRRKLITVGAAGTTALLAGCSGDDSGGDGGDGGGDGGGDDGGDGSDGGDGGGDDSGDGGDDGGDGGDDGSTDQSDGTSGDDDGSTDDSSDDQTDDGSDTGDDQAGDDTADGDGTDDDGAADRTFGQVVSFPRSYEMEATVESEEGTIEMSGRFYEGDLYWEYTLDGRQVEMYFVGEDTFFVAGNRCFEGNQGAGVNREDVDPGEYDSESSELEGLEPVGTDTIDGDDVLVYETSEDMAVGQATYYILADSGYPRRIETSDGRWDFSSWNEADPIEPPDMECQSQYGG